jgi:Cu+-exporting ATPase
VPNPYNSATRTADSFTLTVEGMTCPHCVARVEKAILAVDQVTAANVQLEAGQAHVTGGAPHRVIEAIEAAGYDARPLAEMPDSCSVTESPATSVAPAAEGSYRIDIDDMSCASCVARVEKAILTVDGVSDASVNLVEGAAYVLGGDANTVVNTIIDQGYPARPSLPESLDNARLTFTNPLSSTDKTGIDILFKSIAAESNINWLDNQACELNINTHPVDYLQALEQAGYTATFTEDTEDPYIVQDRQAQQQVRQSIKRALLAGAVGLGLMAGMMTGVLPGIASSSPLTDINGRGFWLITALICLLTMIYSGHSYYLGAWKQLRHGQANMDTLVAVGTAAAWLASLLLILAPDFVPAAHRHLYLDTSVLILAFLQFGHALEVRAKARTGRAIGALVELSPKTARLLRNGHEWTLPVSLLAPGDLFLTKPGEAIATDAIVVEGHSRVDESMITGEPLTVTKQDGSALTGGTINQSGALTARVTRVGDDTTLAGIIGSVKQAQMSKPPIGRLVDRIAAVFVPIVLAIAFFTFSTWYLAGPTPQLPYALTTAIAVLVIACPCALGLATPIAIMVGMGRAAQFGVLIRNGDALQSAADITHLVVDKTGTLTEGRPQVTELYCRDNLNEAQALTWAASLEYLSEHPLAQAILESAQQRNLPRVPVSNFQTEPGQGITATVDDQKLYLGRQEWLAERGTEIDATLFDQGRHIARRGATPIWLANNSHALAVLGLRDPVRRDTPAALATLKSQGIQLVMCTGDHPDTAQSVAQELGIENIHSRVLPQDKVSVIKALQSEGYKVGMVGDGVNDAPALAQANVGFAIGAGTDVAIESADVTLASSSLTGAANAIALSRATLRNIKQNLFGAFVYNTLGIPLAAGVFYPLTGWLLNPVFASVAMALSSVTVVSNANRLRLFKPVE